MCPLSGVGCNDRLMTDATGAEPLATSAPLAAAVARVQERLAHGERALIGITGAPGAGKSTFASALEQRLTATDLATAVVPMDGFHLAHARLVESGQVGVKGAQHTFDADGFVHLLRRVRAQRSETIWAPEFDRSIENPIAGSIAIRPAHRVIVTEGNYLLTAIPPWDQVAALLDEIWYVDPPETTRLTWLIGRHERFGRSHKDAVAHATGSDEHNAHLVEAGKARADWIVGIDV